MSNIGVDDELDDLLRIVTPPPPKKNDRSIIHVYAGVPSFRPRYLS